MCDNIVCTTGCNDLLFMVRIHGDILVLPWMYMYHHKYDYYHSSAMDVQYSYHDDSYR